MEVDKKEVAVIGLGPGGVSAAVYLKRYGMSPYCFEKELVGGKVNRTEKIENYAGIPSIQGPKLGMELETQLSNLDIKPIYKEAKRLSVNEDGTFHVEYGRGLSHDFFYVILANGLLEKPFVIPGQEKFHSRGMSRCAICDGPLYKNKDVAVIGAGNAAFEEALYLASICHHVFLIARRTEYRAQERIVREFASLPNTEILSPYEAVSADGVDSISSLTVRNRQDGKERTLPVQGLFLYVGEIPDTSFLDIQGLDDDHGYIVVDERKMTKVKNLFAVGDCTDTLLRQVVTATSDGAIAATSIYQDYQRNLHE